MNETILTLIKKSHEMVKEKFLSLKSKQEPEDKKDIYLGLREELLAQMECEERIIYLRMTEDIGDEVVEELTYQAEFEHEKIRALVKKLDEIGIENPDWDKQLLRLHEVFEAHNLTEQKVMLPEAMEDFSLKELEQMGENYQRLRSQLDTSLL